MDTRVQSGRGEEEGRSVEGGGTATKLKSRSTTLSLIRSIRPVVAYGMLPAAGRGVGRTRAVVRHRRE